MVVEEDTPKKSILCYGDSNTWGYIPGEGGRFASNVRWPGVVSKLLRTNYRITEEGLNGRTTSLDDTLSPMIERNGLKMFGAIMASHKPVDLAVIMLGTNDLKRRFAYSAVDIAKGVELLAEVALNPEFGPDNQPPDVLVICPPSIWEVESQFGAEFRGGREKSQELRHAFRQMSKRSDIAVMYSEDFMQSDPADGIHLSAESHGILGQEVAKWILDRYDGV